MPQTPSSEIKAKIFLLLHHGKTEQALARCEGFGNQYLLLQAELYAAKNQCGTGLLENEYFEATQSKINDTLPILMTQMTKPAPKGDLLSRI